MVVRVDMLPNTREAHDALLKNRRALFTERLLQSPRQCTIVRHWVTCRTISSAHKQLPHYSGNCADRAYAARFLLCMGNPDHA